MEMVDEASLVNQGRKLDLEPISHYSQSSLKQVRKSGQVETKNLTYYKAPSTLYSKPEHRWKWYQATAKVHFHRGGRLALNLILLTSTH